MKPTLFVRMMGGLGNQLFQYAFARSTALAMGAEVVMDPRYVWRKGHHTGLAIQAFNIQARLATPEELARFVAADFKRWGDAVRLSGFKANE